MRPRWYKVMSDLAGNKVRSLLVIVSIAVGLFAVGLIATLYIILRQDMVTSYTFIHPANIYISTARFDQDFVDMIKREKGVLDAEGIKTFSARIDTGNNRLIKVNLKSVLDYKKMNINQVKLLEGTWPPGDKEIVFDQHKMSESNARVGDLVKIQLPDNKVRELRLVGVVRDQSIGSTGGGGGFFVAALQGYVTYDTLTWLEQTESYNQLLVRVDGDSNNRAYVKEISERLAKKCEDNNHLVVSKVVRLSEEHPNLIYVEAMSGTLFILGFLVVFLSGFLITNTLSSLLNQQMEQIGTMKTVGGRSEQIMAIYSMLILIYSLLGLAISLALSGQSAYWFLGFLAGEINFIPQGQREVPIAIILQLVIALVVPQLAGFFPILRGSSITIQEAFNGTNEVEVHSRTNWSNFLSSKLHLPRPLLLSLRNTFRRKSRLALTLITLTLGGAIFIATFNVQSSMKDYISSLSHYFVADINLSLEKPERNIKVAQAINEIPGIRVVEGWAGARVELLNENDEPGESVNLLAPPAESKLVEPTLLQGRWITPEDQNALAVNELFVSQMGIRPGDRLRLRVNGDKTDWVVVGIFQFAGKSGGYMAYANYDYLSKLIHLPDKATTFQVVSEKPLTTLEQQQQLGMLVEAKLEELGYRVSDISPGFSLLNSASNGLDLMIIFLLVMSILAAIVGSIGLTGTLSMNVLERTREIGVMRAIGASDRSVMRMVITEGMVIGFISWIAGSLLAFPISTGLWGVIGISLFGTSSNFTLNPLGFGLWILLVIVLTVVASYMPARNAARLTIREALAYE